VSDGCKCHFPPLGANSTSPNPLAGFEGHFEVAERGEAGRDGRNIAQPKYISGDGVDVKVLRTTSMLLLNTAVKCMVSVELQRHTCTDH